MIACANSSQHTVNLHSTPFAVRTVQNTRSKHNQFQRKTNMIINSRHLHCSLIITARRFKTRLKFIFDLKPISLITQCIITTDRRLCSRTIHGMLNNKANKLRITRVTSCSEIRKRCAIECNVKLSSLTYFLSRQGCLSVEGGPPTNVYSVTLVWPWVTLTLTPWPWYSTAAYIIQKWSLWNSKVTAWNGHRDKLYCSCDLDVEPMTLTCEDDLDILRTESEAFRSRLSKVRGQRGQTDRQTDTNCIATPHSMVVNTAK